VHRLRLLISEIPMTKMFALAVLALALIAGTAATVALNSAPAHASCTSANC
jgi:hypothetical protein